MGRPQHWGAEYPQKYHINILAVKQDGEMELRITPDTVLTKDQTLLVIGEYRSLQKCFHI